ncbi:MAG: LytR/AlgR family response regulator transcription factor [Owenweeksia sp.]
MMQVNVILVDDEEAALENLSYILDEYCPEVNILAAETSIARGIRSIKHHKPDLVFLDISMPPEGQGFDLLKAFPNRDFHVIFVTAHEDHSLQALKKHAFDYILKPVDYQEIVESVEHIKVWMKRSQTKADDKPETIKLSTMEGVHILRPDQVLYCKANGSYTMVALEEGGSILVSKTLKNLESYLPQNGFFRVHRSYIININKVKKLLKKDGGFVEVTDGTLVPVSENYREDILNILS